MPLSQTSPFYVYLKEQFFQHRLAKDIKDCEQDLCDASCFTADDVKMLYPGMAEL